MLIIGIHLHLLHHVRGPAIDYVGVAFAAFLSWFGLPGPGEPVLIAAATVSAKHKLDLTPVVSAACAGAVVGGILGWLGGMIAGRSVLTAPGPLRHMRLRAVERGQELFKRREVLGVLLTPSWVAGINRAGVVVFNVTNALSAMAWAVGIGVGAYIAGPIVLDIGEDVGLIASVVLVILIVATVGGEIIRRRRREAQGSLSD